jgi:uncharacterized Fe-S cluster-containing radical SAM superfamily protein
MRMCTKGNDMQKYETVTITRKQYEQLKRDSDVLERLHDAGVDNWEGYYRAFQEDEDE